MFNFGKKKLFKMGIIILITIKFLSICLKKSEIKNISQSEQNPQQSNLTLLVESFLENKEVNFDKEFDVLDLAERKSNIALNYYNEWKSYSNSDEWKEKGIDVCDTSLPTIEEIDFNDIFWQTIKKTDKKQHFLYNAYYDNRGEQKNVRVVVERHPSKDKLWSVIESD